MFILLYLLARDCLFYTKYNENKVITNCIDKNELYFREHKS